MGSNPSPDGGSSNQGESRYDGIEENSENRVSKNSRVKEGESSQQSRYTLRRAPTKEQKELQTKSIRRAPAQEQKELQTKNENRREEGNLSTHLLQIVFIVAL
jgi:hypothetical protein